MSDLEDEGTGHQELWCSSRGAGAVAEELALGWDVTSGRDTPRGQGDTSHPWVVGKTRLGGSKAPGATPAVLESSAGAIALVWLKEQ